ncbi:hypothetical protein QBA54_37490 [Streptomyces sp. B21-108]|uniref:hypothetical protein n=1 Tax=Streptomyces sp. B21-108 TaxID=3039419 RepID=UPI002FF41915
MKQSEIDAILGVGQASMSRAMGLLVERGIVLRSGGGRGHRYALNPAVAGYESQTDCPLEVSSRAIASYGEFTVRKARRPTQSAQILGEHAQGRHGVVDRRFRTRHHRPPVSCQNRTPVRHSTGAAADRVSRRRWGSATPTAPAAASSVTESRKLMPATRRSTTAAATKPRPTMA